MKEQIQQHLPSQHPWRNSIVWFDVIDSTNTQAKELAAAGAPAGTVLVADMQTGGRGRMGRSFHSPAGTGIYLSVVLRPECRPEELMHLTCACAVSARQAIQKVTGLDCGIKWINDLVLNGKKVAGILTELSMAADGKVRHAIVGIGINCSQQPGDFPPEIASIATSLAMEAEKPIDRSRLTAALIEQFSQMDQMLLSGKDTIMEAYRKSCITLGKEVSVHRFASVRHGIARRLDADGGLTVQFPDGSLETVNAGEVSVRGMYGYI